MFAYGATGAGKTHTMLGSQNDPGVMYRTMKELFKRIDDAKEEKEFAIAFSYLEVNIVNTFIKSYKIYYLINAFLKAFNIQMNWVMFTALFVVIYRFTMNRSGTCWRMPALLLSERTVLKEWLFRALHCIRLVES